MPEELLRITTSSDLSRILKAKWLHFSRRSVWRLLLAALFITVGLYMSGYNGPSPVSLLLLLMIGLCMISVIVMLISARSLARQRANYPIQLLFYPDFLIWQDMKTEKELKIPASQVRWYRESATGVVFYLHAKPLLSEYIIIERQRLPASDYDQLLQWLKK